MLGALGGSGYLSGCEVVQDIRGVVAFGMLGADDIA